MKGMNKIKRGTGFRGCLDYALDHKGDPGKLIGGNMCGSDARELAAEFGAVRQLRPDIEKPVWHNSLRLPEGEKLTDEKWVEIADDYMRRMGFTDNHQRTYVLHDPDHIHIVANRISSSGEIYLGQNENLKSTSRIQELERVHGLTITKGPDYDPASGKVIMPDVKQLSSNEINRAVRTGEPPARAEIQAFAQAAAVNCHSYTEYSERLRAVGVELLPVLQKDDTHISGLSYKYNGMTIKGSDIGKKFTASGLKKDGISYDKDRDGATARADISRAASKSFGITDRELAAVENQERRAVSTDDRAIGSGNSGIDGREPADARADRPAQRSDSETDRPAAPGADRSNHDRDSGSSRDASRGESSERQDVGRVDIDRSNSGGAYDRVISLAAETAPAPGELGRGSSGKALGPGNRTAAAVDRQTAAISVDRYEIGIRDAKKGLMMNRTYTGDELKKAMPWLQRQNAKGDDIYIRPAGDNHALVLVDDLKKSAIEQMKAKGYAPAAIVETSPGNYQCWVKISDTPQPADVRKLAAQALAKHFGGDLNSADSQHYGRLAGFTNRKPKHEKQGRSPYVLAHECTGAVADKGPQLVHDITQRLEQQRDEQHRQAKLDAIKATTTGVMHHKTTDAYRAEYAVLLERYGVTMDTSKADYMIAKSLAKKGYGADYIAGAIRTESPAIETRKAGHADDYAQRTVAAAERTDDVRAARAAERKRSNNGPSL